MSDPYIGEIKTVAFDYAPIYWATCDGQLLNISQNSALFALIGTTYGGDGTTNFALPDLRGRAPMHQGTGVGLTQRIMGQKIGAETAVVAQNELGGHNHQLNCSNQPGTTASPVNNFPAGSSSNNYSTVSSSLVQLNQQTVSSVGNGQSHNNMMPFLTVNYIICLEGIFPQQN